jgi:RimJ/RimL family protein N-acetyltransferase
MSGKASRRTGSSLPRPRGLQTGDTMNARDEMRLETVRLIVRNMRSGDTQRMELWRPYRDPLHRLWHLPRSRPLTQDAWSLLRGADPKTMWWTIEHRQDQRVIGALSLREISRPVSARLGIRLSPNYVDQGYGTEVLKAFLPYFFGTMGFHRMLLDVAATNTRAVHVYEKLGFRHCGKHYRNIPRGEDLSFLDQEQYRPLLRFFRRHRGRMQLLFHDMVLELEVWELQASVHG